jgi:hypothetical protein
MKIRYLLFFCFSLMIKFSLSAQQTTIWSESFEVSEKGYWGDGVGIVESMDGITKWSINASACVLSSTSTYIKTVATLSKRMEAKAINGEAVWTSETIDISSKPYTNISIDVSETGSSSNTNKYLKFYYKLDGGSETLFETNGSNVGNFTSAVATQSGLNGSNLQIIARVNNPVSDACIFDNVVVSYDNVKPTVSKIVSINSNTIRIILSEPVKELNAETIANYNIAGIGNPASAVLNADKSSVDLVFLSNFIDLQQYTIDISGLADLSGNVMEAKSLEFVYKNFRCDKVYAISQTQLLLKFSHQLNQTSAETEANYSVNGGMNNPSSAILQSDTVVILTFLSNFTNNTEYQLTINNLANIYSTVLNNSNSSFTWHNIQEFDLVINELMLDVNPLPNVLPAAKYIEIYNRSGYDIYVSGWTYQIGDNSPATIPDFAFNKNAYVIICASGQTANLNSFGKTIGILSESQLTTTGKPITLFNQLGKLIDYINYSDNWYGNPAKASGGWSLERIDANNFCGETPNWAASTDFKGGTPGTINSVSHSNQDNSKPTLIKVQILSSNKLALNFSKNISGETGLNSANYQLDNGSNLPANISFPDTCRSTIIIQFTGQFIDAQEQTIQISNLKDFCGNTIDLVTGRFTYYLIHPTSVFAESGKIVHLIFSEEVDITSAQTSSNYLANNGLGSPSTAVKHTTKKNEVYLEYAGNMTSGQTYSIHIESIKDLSNNSIKPADLSFVYYEPSPTDLVINEILFNPRPSGADFVEIYNKSVYPIDLSKISIGRRNETGELESIKVLTSQNYLLYPYHFLAISSDTSIVKNEYPAISFDKFIQISSMPSFNDDEGTAVILKDDLVIDEFAYNTTMHFALISNAEGVSLERVDPDQETQLASNWHSAAESYGYASPANQNSQFRKFSETIDDEVVVEPETFSPNSDGYNDVAFIHYKFNEPGYVANVSVYDGKGRIVKRLAANELLAVEGEYSWDGLHEDGSKALIGIYVIYFEVFNLDGVVKKFKKVCVVADRLK